MDIKQQLIEAATPHINDEICGFICSKNDDFYYLDVKNRSPYPDQFFYISAVDFLQVKREHELVGVFHNHSVDSEEPSLFDKTVSENICYPMVVYSNMTKRFKVYVPEDIDCDQQRVKELEKKLT